MEKKDYNFTQHTMAHIAFPCSKADFAAVVARVKDLAVPIASGPKAQRDGEAILLRDPSGNIFEVCYPPLTLTKQGSEPASAGDAMQHA